MKTYTKIHHEFFSFEVREVHCSQVSSPKTSSVRWPQKSVLTNRIGKKTHVWESPSSLRTFMHKIENLILLFFNLQVEWVKNKIKVSLSAVLQNKIWPCNSSVPTVLMSYICPSFFRQNFRFYKNHGKASIDSMLAFRGPTTCFREPRQQFIFRYIPPVCANLTSLTLAMQNVGCWAVVFFHNKLVSIFLTEEKTTESLWITQHDLYK